MNWDAIGAIAETLGAVGVIASLVYLATQIRQNTSTVRSSAASSLAETNMSLSVFLAQEDVNRIWWDGLANPEGLPEAELRRFHSIVAAANGMLQQSHSHFIEGAMSETNWAGQRQFLKWLTDQPGYRRSWTEWSSSMNPEFVALVEEILGEEPDRGE
jgi:hypothetical protein